MQAFAMKEIREAGLMDKAVPYSRTRLPSEAAGV
jgi:hypothetical protein